MPVWICATCANHYPEAPSPPGACVICSDERQWVPSSGQRWTTAAELAAFRDHLQVLGAPVARRYSGGAEIGAACGTLAASRCGGEVLSEPVG